MELPKPNPQEDKLVSNGHEYANTPRMREFVRRADEIRNSLPPVQNEYVRLWRGNRPNEMGQNPSFTNSLEGIALPFLDAYGGKLSYLDIPEADLDKFVRTVGVAPDSEFILPAELTQRAIGIE